MIVTIKFRTPEADQPAKMKEFTASLPEKLAVLEKFYGQTEVGFVANFYLRLFVRLLYSSSGPVLAGRKNVACRRGFRSRN
jgi:hypothetical protein